MVQELSVTPTLQNPVTVRAAFYKTGVLQYISHLDLVRTMTRIIVRSGVPVWYSQGFNPRLKLTFALPLSIGTQSDREFFDIRLTAPMSLEEIKQRLNAELTEDMRVTDVYVAERKFSDIAWAEYEIRMVSPKLTSETAAALADLYTHELIMTKRSKAGDKDVNIQPSISLKSCVYRDGGISVRAMLAADNENYLNPEYLMKAAEQKLGIVFDDPFTEYYNVYRREVYLSDCTTVFR